MRKLVLWGHHVDEYQAMFALTHAEMSGRLLEFGCGASAVNATLSAQGQYIVSVDPLFSLEYKPLREEVQALFDSRASQVIAEPTQFDAQQYGGVEALLANRRAGMQLFFQDYPSGHREQRYVAYPDPDLPFKPAAFDYALSSHFLFADATTQSVDWHLQTIRELARVAQEVRIFPLIDRLGQASILLGPVLLGLQQANYGVEVREVDYALYPQGNAMLRVWAKQCEVD